jgi:hypothetical protein
MKRAAVLLGIILLTSLAFWPITRFVSESDSFAVTKVLGMPVYGVSSSEMCWLSVGLGGGVLFVGLAGGGVVAFGAAASAGLLFGSGQLAVGMIAIGQLGLGLVHTLAQIGVGMTGRGQLILGLLVRGQVGIGKDGKDFLATLGDDLDQVLSFKDP